VLNNVTGGTVTVTNTTLDITGQVTGGTINATNATVDVGGQITGATINATTSTVDVAGQMTGGSVTLNSSELLVGTGGGSQPSVTGGTIVYGTGVDSVFLANISSSANSVQLQNLYNNDSIAESNIPFNSATLTGSTLTLKEGSATVATINNVTLAAGASTTFEPVTTEVIGGTTYYVATLDPPPGASDPLTAPINQNNVLDTGHGKFLQGSTSTTVPKDGAPDPFAGKLAGAPHGDHLGLTPTLASKQLLADLTNIGNVTNGLGNGGNDQGVGSGHQTPPHTGIGSALTNLDNGGKPDFKDLLTHNPTIVPRH
jgi:hypothetical protein